MTETNESTLKCGDISDEKSRSYTVYACGEGNIHIVHISRPKKVFFGRGHAFHRIFDGECVVLAPAPGFIREGDKIVGFCELSWEPSNLEDPCQW